MKRVLGMVRGSLVTAATCSALIGGQGEHPGSGRAQRVSLDYMITVTGGELLRGVYADGHTQYLTRTLSPWGGRCLGSISVDDRAQDIMAALAFATPKAPLVIVTGGLGPTDADITRQTLSQFTGIALQEEPSVIRELDRRFGSPRSPLPANLRRQSQVPVRGGYLPNPQGTAVGLIFEAEPAVIVALPGPPRELRPMVTEALIPWLARRYGLRAPGSSVTCRFVGIGESRIDQVLKGMIALPPEVTIASQFEGGRVDVSFLVPAEIDDGPARLRRIQDQIRQQLGEYLYSEDGRSLEQVLAGRLRDAGHSVALVEIGTGGDLAAAFHATPEMKTVLGGAFVAPSEPAMSRLLGMQWAADQNPGASPDRLAELAEAARSRAGCSCALGVGEPHAAGDGKSLWIVVRGQRIDPENAHLAWRGSDRESRARLVTQILDFMRRTLPVP